MHGVVNGMFAMIILACIAVVMNIMIERGIFYQAAHNFLGALLVSLFGFILYKAIQEQRNKRKP